MAEPVWSVKVDWNNNGSFADANEDVSASLLDLEFTIGRGSASDVIAAGRGSFTLEDPAGVYSRYNAASPIYGQMLPSREVKIESVHSAVTYPGIRGIITDMAEGRRVNGIPTVTFQVTDGMELLRRATKVRTPLQESKRVDELIGTVLDAAGWSGARRNLDTAITTLPRWWAFDGNAADLLRALALNELEGLAYLNGAGDVRFQGKDFRASAAVYATISDAVGSALSIRQSDLIDRVSYTRAGLTQESAVSVLWSLSPQGRMIMPGSTHPLNTIEFKLALGGKALVSPVAVTDYNVNSAADGSGTDKTAQVTVDGFTAYGGGGTIVLNNLDSAPVYLFGASGAPGMQVRGQAITRTNEARTIERLSPAPLVSNQPLTGGYEWNDDADAIAALAGYRANVLAIDQPRPVIQLTGHTDAEIAAILGMDVSKRVTLALTTGLYPAYLSGAFFVESYTIKQRPEANVECTLTLWSADQALGNGFRVSSDTTPTYGVIAADAATTGDRIWL